MASDLMLSLLHGFLGKMERDSLDKLKAVMDNPTQQTWRNAYAIVLNCRPRPITLWQAVHAVDKTFPRVAREGAWRKIPTKETLRAAVAHAVFDILTPN
jgi:hypothetical protein